MSLEDASYDHRGQILIRFDKGGLEALMYAINDNNRGEFFDLIQTEPGEAYILCRKLSWQQRLEAVARRNLN